MLVRRETRRERRTAGRERAEPGRGGHPSQAPDGCRDFVLFAQHTTNYHVASVRSDYTWPRRDTRAYFDGPDGAEVAP